MDSRAPIPKPRPIGVGHSKREISNFTGMRLANELTKEIPRGGLKIDGIIHLLNYTVI